MLLRTFLIGTGIALFGCAPLTGQADLVPPATERAILQAVSAHVLDDVESKMAHVERDVDVVFDRAVLQGGAADRGAVWPPAVLETLGSIPGLRVATLQDFYSCPQDAPPGHCFLEGADIVVTIGRPDLDGDPGTIIVRQVSRSSADIDSPRAYRSSAGLKIEKVDGAWEVVGVDFISVSE